MIVWKHHIAENFENGVTPTKNNGVGAGGTVFFDFDKMKNWLMKNDARRFYVAPISARPDQLMPTEDEPNVDHSLMADAKETIMAAGDFAPIEYWEQNRHTITASNWSENLK